MTKEFAPKRVSVMASISTGSIFFLHLVDKRCISILANTSLPVPFSPVMRIFASVAATFSTIPSQIVHHFAISQYIMPVESFPPFLLTFLSVGLFLSLASMSVPDQFLIFKRLHDEVGGTFLDACYGKLDVGIGGKEHHLGFRAEVLDFPSQYNSSFPELIPLEKFMSSSTTSGCSSLSLAGMLGRVGDGDDAIEYRFQQHPYHGQDVAVVINNQYRSLFLCHYFFYYLLLKLRTFSKGLFLKPCTFFKDFLFCSATFPRDFWLQRYKI